MYCQEGAPLTCSHCARAGEWSRTCLQPSGAQEKRRRGERPRACYREFPVVWASRAELAEGLLPTLGAHIGLFSCDLRRRLGGGSPGKQHWAAEKGLGSPGQQGSLGPLRRCFISPHSLRDA